MKLSIATALFVLLPALCAEGSGPPEPRLLDLNVIALDSRGQPVRDLTADDFQITDAGKPQKISFFRVNRAGEHQEPGFSLGPHDFSNRTAGQPRGATVILLDMLNMGFGARGYAANQLEHDLPLLADAGSVYLYVVSVDGAVFPVHDVRPPAPPGEDTGSQPEPASAHWNQRAKPMLDNVIHAVTKVRSVDIDVFTRILLTFHALETLGARVAAIPGRKNIIWATDGVPIFLGELRSDIGQPIDFTPEIRKLSEALDRSFISLYPVRQIMMGRPDNIGATSDGDGATGGGGTGLSEIATMDLLADLTGGRRSSDKVIGAAIQQSLRDLNFSYQIGYFPPGTNFDDKFHKLRVTTARKGVRIQAKAGYYAWKMEAGSRSSDAFRATANAPLDAAEIGLRASVAPDPAKAGATILTLRIDAQDVSLISDGDRFTGQLRLMVAEYAENGAVSSTPAAPLDIRFTAAQRDAALKDGIVVTESVPPGETVNRLRVMVFDRGSNGIGSVTIPGAAFAGH